MNDPIALLNPLDKSNSDRFLYVLYIALIIWLPLPLGSNRGWAWSLMEIWTSLLAIGWIILFIRGRISTTPALEQVRYLLYLFAAWLALLVIQIIPLPFSWLELLSPVKWEIFTSSTAVLALPGSETISVDRFATVQFLLKSISYVTLFVLTLLLINNRERLNQLLTIIVYCGAYQATYGIMLTLTDANSLIFFDINSQSTNGTFVNRNHFAGYLEMTSAAGIGLLMANLNESHSINWRQRIRNTTAWILSKKLHIRIMLAVMVIGLVMSHSRMGNSAFFSSLLITTMIWLFTGKKRPKRSAVLLIGSLILIDIYIVGAWFGVDKVIDRLENTTVSAETRDEVFRDSLDYIKQHPILGSGGGTFYTVYPYYRKDDSGTGYYNFAHNDYLQIAAETGLIGLTLIGLTVLITLRHALVTLKRRKSVYTRGILFGSIMGITALLIHSSVDFNLQIPANAAMFILLMALPWCSSTIKRDETIA